MKKDWNKQNDANDKPEQSAVDSQNRRMTSTPDANVETVTVSPEPENADHLNENGAMQRFATLLVLISLLSLAMIALLNRQVDPYQIFSARIDDRYDDKPALHANMRLHKAFQTRLLKPEVLILGSSRAIQGIPVEHGLFNGRRVYNMAMPLASMKEITLSLRHVNEINPVDTVVLGLDFLSFNTLARTDGPAAGFKPDRLLGNDQTRTPISDYLSALISLDALRASIQVLKTRRQSDAPLSDQKASEYRIMTGRGGREDQEIRSRLLDGGHRSNTLKIEEFFTSAVYLPSPHRRFSFQNEDENSLYWFEQLLVTLHENDMDAALFISPNHARLNELIDAAGLWTQFEQWKRDMLALTLTTARDQDATPYDIVDFSVPSDITTEPFPPAGDSDTRMRYYYESIHYSQLTGALVLDQFTQLQANSEASRTSVFGRVMREDSIDALLGEAREKQTRFRHQFPDYRQELDTIVENR